MGQKVECYVAFQVRLEVELNEIRRNMHETTRLLEVRSDSCSSEGLCQKGHFS